MRVKLIQTDGPWLPAILEHGQHRLCVMDDFSSDERFAPKPGDDFEVELSALTDERMSWEAMFAGNPNKTKGLESIRGWSYRAFGEIVSVNPVIVDCGIVSVPDVVHSHDSRVIGEFVVFTISRLDATLGTPNQRIEVRNG
jgi:hypothetical protein